MTDPLIQNEINALCDDLYCNTQEREIVQKTIDGIVAAVKIQTFGTAALVSLTGRCKDYSRTFIVTPEGSQITERLCNHVTRAECIVETLRP